MEKIGKQEGGMALCGGRNTTTNQLVTGIPQSLFSPAYLSLPVLRVGRDGWGYSTVSLTSARFMKVNSLKNNKDFS